MSRGDVGWIALVVIAVAWTAGSVVNVAWKVGVHDESLLWLLEVPLSLLVSLALGIPAWRRTTWGRQ